MLQTDVGGRKQLKGVDRVKRLQTKRRNPADGQLRAAAQQTESQNFQLPN